MAQVIAKVGNQATGVGNLSNRVVRVVIPGGDCAYVCSGT